MQIMNVIVALLGEFVRERGQHGDGKESDTLGSLGSPHGCQSCSLAGAVERHSYHVTQMIEGKSISKVCFDHACSLQLSLYRRHQPPN